MSNRKSAPTFSMAHTAWWSSEEQSCHGQGWGCARVSCTLSVAPLSRFSDLAFVVFPGNDLIKVFARSGFGILVRIAQRNQGLHE